MPPEVIIECGAEGGSLRLLRRGSKAEGWEYQVHSIDSGYAILDEEDGGGRSVLERHSPWVDSWAGAMALLDGWPWARLRPQQVHADCRAQVLTEVIERLMPKPDRHTRQSMQSWAAVCQSARA